MEGMYVMGIFLLVCYLFSLSVGKTAPEDNVDLKAISCVAPILPCDAWWEDFGDLLLSRCMKREEDRAKRRQMAHEYFSLMEKHAQRQITEELLQNRKLELELLNLREDNHVKGKKSHSQVEGKIRQYEEKLKGLDKEIANCMKFELTDICLSQSSHSVPKGYQNSCYKGLSSHTDNAIAKINKLDEKMEHVQNELALHRAAHELILLRSRYGLEKYSKIYEVNEQFLLTRLKEVTLSFALKRAYVDFIGTLER